MERFTWFAKFGEAMMRIPDERMRERFAYAVAVYGSTGEVVALDWPLDAIFAACVEDIDNSKQANTTGSRGGRPRKRQAEQAPGEHAEGVSAAAGSMPAESENPPFAKAETPLSESGKPPFRESENPPFAKAETPLSDPLSEKRKPNTSQANTSQANTSQAIKERVARAPAADPLGEPARGGYPEPTPAEVEAYVEASGGHRISGEDFVGWYRDHGWPPAGWHGSAMRWSRQEAERGAARAGRALSSPAGRAAAEARRGAAELAARYDEDARTEVVA